MSTLRRLLRHPAAPLAVALAAALALPGMFLRDPVLFDSFTIEVKGRVLSPLELFAPAQTEVANPYYRPLLALLVHGLWKVTGGNPLAQRGLALAGVVFAALALARFARVLGLPRRVATAAVLLFSLLPGNVVTAAWPVAVNWSLSGAFTLLAAAELVRLAQLARGPERARARAAVARTLLFALLGLLCSETPYQLVALAPVVALFLVVPSAGARRGAALGALAVAWVAACALILVHFKVFERTAQNLATTAPMVRIANALRTFPLYLAGALGGDDQTGSRTLAAVVGAVALLGLVRFRRRALFLVAFVLAAPLPFAAIGHNDRYGLYPAAAALLAVAAGARRGVARIAALAGARSPGARRRALAAGDFVPLVLGAAFLLQLPPRLATLRDVGRSTGQLLADLDSHRAEVADVDHTDYVNVPYSLRWPLFERLGVTRPEQLVAPPFRSWLCTDDAYFGLAAAGPARAESRRALVLDGGRLVVRPAQAPLGARRLEPAVFLAGGFEVVARPDGLATGSPAEQEFRAGLLARIEKLAAPRDHVVLERAPEGLVAPLPTEKVAWRIEPLAPSPELEAAVRQQASVLAVRLVAEVEVPRAALLVVVTYLASEDPLHRLTCDTGRFGDLLAATVDGRPAPILPAFVHGCGIVVPAGKHEVVLLQKLFAGNEFGIGGGR
ncbi:MAG TPA: hypothetical protein VFG37_13570 [Planctomycetota bacterium]|nr:hypothetical protein [Planctomycetota bacterium]